MQIIGRDRQQIYHTASPAPWGHKAVGAYDYKGAWGGRICSLFSLWHWACSCIYVKAYQIARFHTCSLLYFNYTSVKLLETMCAAVGSSYYERPPGLQQKRIKPDPSIHHQGARLSLLPGRRTFHASYFLSLWLISGWENCRKVFKTVKPKREAPVQAKWAAGPYLEGSGRRFGLTHPCRWSPTSSQQIAEKPVPGLDVWPLGPLWESLPSSQLKTVLQKNKIMIKGSSVASHWALMGKFVWTGATWRTASKTLN